MRVLIVNTSEKTGGAAVAANRLMAALNNNGVKAKMLVRDKQTDDITVVGLQHRRQARWHFLWERWCVFWHLRFSKQHLFEIDIANSGFDITHLREFREADVIHLSWINQGMLSPVASRWCGPCTTFGRPRVFVIMPKGAHATMASADNASYCPVAVELPICLHECSVVNVLCGRSPISSL